MAMRDGDGTPDGDYSPRGDGDGGKTLPDSVHGDGDGEIFYFAGAGTGKQARPAKWRSEEAIGSATGRPVRVCGRVLVWLVAPRDVTWQHHRRSLRARVRLDDIDGFVCAVGGCGVHSPPLLSCHLAGFFLF